MSNRLMMVEELVEVNRAIETLRDKLTSTLALANRLEDDELPRSIRIYRDSFYDADIDRGIEDLIREAVAAMESR